MTTDRNRPAQTSNDIYERVTNQIIAAIEAGAGEYRMPWHHDGSAITTPVNVASRKVYRGVNVIALWAAAQAAGYPAGIWGTYRQWHELGAQVRKGGRGHLVVFWKTSDRSGDADRHDGDEDHDKSARRLFARGYTVFNAAQVDGYTPPEMPVLPEVERIEHAERFCSALGIDIRHGGSQACYIPSKDHVQMPEFTCFRDAIAYYAVILHECGHYAVSRIMPHGRVWRRLGLLFAMRQFGIMGCVLIKLPATLRSAQPPNSGRKADVSRGR